MSTFIAGVALGYLLFTTEFFDTTRLSQQKKIG